MERLENRTAHRSPETEPTEIPSLDAYTYYRSVFWAAADAILVADESGRYLDANHAAATLLGYTPEELLSMCVADVVAPGAAWAAAEYDRYLHDGTWSGELDLRRRDGTLVPVEAHATVVQRREGMPVYLSVIRDISARRAAERAQQDFLAMVAHELKTPLTAILGNAQLMQRRAVYNAPATDAIVSQARRLQRLIDDLRDVAHFAAGSPELRRSSVDLASLAREAAAQAITVTPEHPVQVEAPEQLLAGWWDGDRVTQVLQNLLANAAKYSPAGSTITVRVAAGAGEALVSVADRGVGIDPEELPRLFERFYRTDAATQSGAEGLGLGLHICKLLVEAHGGRIWVESMLGQGTIVSFTLPCTQAPAG
ncbi:MAG TPA: ATP-binding protein [Chloroflexota bacterium]|nr:ATP-binding protein [Chloroflexota bacterium]